MMSTLFIKDSMISSVFMALNGIKKDKMLNLKITTEFQDVEIEGTPMLFDNEQFKNTFGVMNKYVSHGPFLDTHKGILVERYESDVAVVASDGYTMGIMGIYNIHDTPQWSRRIASTDAEVALKLVYYFDSDVYLCPEGRTFVSKDGRWALDSTGTSPMIWKPSVPAGEPVVTGILEGRELFKILKSLKKYDFVDITLDGTVLCLGASKHYDSNDTRVEKMRIDDGDIDHANDDFDAVTFNIEYLLRSLCLFEYSKVAMNLYMIKNATGTYPVIMWKWGNEAAIAIGLKQGV
jgi:hypothetical protein